MPKLSETTDKFKFYWYQDNISSLRVPECNIKEILHELILQYADHIFNLFRTGETESLNAVYNLDLLKMVEDELKVIDYKK